MSKEFTTIVAIDGPAGAGKSSIAKALARRLKYAYLDSGAMYRCIALKALRQGVDPHQAERIVDLINGTLVDFQNIEGENRVLLDGEDVTEEIRRPEVDMYTSAISTIPQVRALLRARQREIGKRGNVVAEGRDMGTRVFPEAGTKIFLTAEFSERARRRYAQMKAMGMNPSFEEVMESLRKRDAQDEARETDPLMPAKDAIILDSTHLSEDEVVEAILSIMGKRTSGGGHDQGKGLAIGRG